MHHYPSIRPDRSGTPRRRRSDRHGRLARRAATLVIVAISLIGIFSSARPAHATVQTSGIVYAFYNDPVNGLTYGLPFFGNDVDYDPLFPNPTTFEYNAVMGPVLPNGTDTATGDNEIVVGKGAQGTLLISGASILRAEDLIVGDSTTVNNNPRGGTGTVRVTGFGSTYNNDPGITALHPSVLGTGWVTIRANDGNKLILGRGNGSTGTLDVSAGGIMEIQDAVILGQAIGSTGIITVDGFDSYFGSGGFDMGSTTDLHLMLIGLLGKGVLTIKNSATVITEASALDAGGGNAEARLAASIGSLPFEGNEPPAQNNDPGAQGNVLVTGPNSKWILGGALQIGGFHNVTATGGGPLAGIDFEGDTVVYPAQAAAATLRIADGGLVNMRPAIASTTDPLLLAIGRFGHLELAGGWLTMRDADPDAVAPRLINDGVISGWGRIDTGIFANRYLGEIIVGPGQQLTVAASSVPSTLPGGTAIRPMQNYGTIEVIGTVDSRAELIIERSPGTPGEIVEPFLNLLLMDQPDPPASRGGLITGEYATLRFGSGIKNLSRVAFTAGLNIVHGDFVNVGDPNAVDGDIEGDIGDFTEILVTGPNTRVNFENLLAMTGNSDINLENGGNIVALQDFAAFGGELSIELSKNNPSSITVLGDVGLAGIEFNLKLANDAFPLMHGDSFKLLTFGGQVTGVDITTDPDHPVPDLSVVPTIGTIVTEISVSPALALLAAGLVPVIELADEGIYALFLDPTMVGTTPGGAVGPDFNGDGMVDALDLAIWQMNVGIESGASVLQGDADGDGDVDGDDLAFWARNVGMPPPWAGAGSGAGGGLGASVPEPTGLAMLLSGGLLALARRRQRHAPQS